MGTDRGAGTALTRRGWLAATLAASARTAASRAADPDARLQAEAREREAVAAIARKAGLGPFRVTRSDHYLAIGDAPARFRAEALEICETLAQDYQAYFQGKGFAVELPAVRMIVVALAGARELEPFLGEDPGALVGGTYDLDTNRLIVFDFRTGGGVAVRNPLRVNTIALVHEATHQLTFNTGLLDRRGDVPHAISEGLAMFVENRPARGHNPPGQLNLPRLQALQMAERQRLRWIPVSRLLAQDGPLLGDNGAEIQQLALSESWALVDRLLKDPDRRPQFRDYLKAIRSRRDASHRLQDARAHLGDLDRLDQDVRRSTKWRGPVEND